LSSILVVFMFAAALADGGFYGGITYINCDCTQFEDKVYIQPVLGGEGGVCNIDCLCNLYNTYGCDPSTYPPGTYRMWVASPGCKCNISYVVHGSEDQEVNFTVRGPEETPDGGGE
jgi:hypothetical protein